MCRRHVNINVNKRTPDSASPRVLWGGGVIGLYIIKRYGVFCFLFFCIKGNYLVFKYGFSVTFVTSLSRHLVFKGPLVQ